jgi:hypothetical protein
MKRQLHLINVYGSFLCGIIFNVLTPWSPPMYSFHVKGSNLARFLSLSLLFIIFILIVIYN